MSLIPDVLANIREWDGMDVSESSSVDRNCLIETIIHQRHSSVCFLWHEGARRRKYLCFFKMHWQSRTNAGLHQFSGDEIQ